MWGARAPPRHGDGAERLESEVERQADREDFVRVNHPECQLDEGDVVVQVARVVPDKAI